MSEEDIKLQYITPAIVAKWDKSKITMETKITDRKICLNCNFVHRDKKSAKYADYVLYWSNSFPIAIVEPTRTPYEQSNSAKNDDFATKDRAIPYIIENSSISFQMIDIEGTMMYN